MSNEAKVLQELTELVGTVAPSVLLSSDGDYDRTLNEIGIDSLDAMSLLLEVQERFDVEVPDEVVDKLTSLRSIATYILEKQN